MNTSRSVAMKIFAGSLIEIEASKKQVMHRYTAINPRNNQKTARNCRFSPEVGFNYFRESIEVNTNRDSTDTIIKALG